MKQPEEKVEKLGEVNALDTMRGESSRVINRVAKSLAGMETMAL